jgi:hypothetical protein
VQGPDFTEVRRLLSPTHVDPTPDALADFCGSCVVAHAENSAKRQAPVSIDLNIAVFSCESRSPSIQSPAVGLLEKPFRHPADFTAETDPRRPSGPPRQFPANHRYKLVAGPPGRVQLAAYHKGLYSSI